MQKHYRDFILLQPESLQMKSTIKEINFQIRPYTISDKDECMLAFKSNMPTYFAEHEVPDFESWLDRLDGQKAGDATYHRHYYVGVLEGKIVGCGGFGYDKNKNEATLAWGLLHADAQKKGFGKALLTYRLQCIKSFYPNCSVLLDTTQKTFEFFEGHGFVVEKVTENSYAPGLHRYDMRLTFY
jgi:ribosomal-protein-alanine N-acetyltransferase